MRFNVRFMMLLLVAVLLLAGSAGAKQLTVYSSNPTGLIDHVVQAFEEEYGIEVLIVRAGQGELLQRIIAESARPLADVMWGFSKEALEGHTQYLHPYLPEATQFMDAEYFDPEGYWVGNMIHLQVVMANDRLLGDTPAPTSWEALLDPKWKDQIVYADPAVSGSSYTQLTLLLQVFAEDGEPGWDKVEELLNITRIVGGSGLVYRGVGDGEYPLGITMEYAAYRYVDGGAPISMIYPEEGTVAQPECSAIVKGTQNLENAQLFQEFVNSRDVRISIFNEFFRRPARSDISVAELAPGLLDIAEVNIAPYDTEWASANRTEILRKAQDIIMRKY